MIRSDLSDGKCVEAEMVTEQRSAKAAWEADYQQLQELIASLSDAELKRATDNAGWTVRNLAAHLAGADSFVSMCVKPISQGKGLMPVPLPNWLFNKIGDFSNGRQTKKFARASAAELAAAIMAEHKKAAALLDAVPESGWSKRGAVPTMGKVTLAEYLHGQVKHNAEHESTLHKAIGR